MGMIDIDDVMFALGLTATGYAGFQLAGWLAVLLTVGIVAMIFGILRQVR